MSHIDSFKHQLVGYFFGLPVYLPLEDIDGDFECTTKQLLIGGGSGEHPALVIKNPLATVAMYLHEQTAELELSDEEEKEFEAYYEPYLTWKTENILNFCDWDVKVYHDFYKRCRAKRSLNSYRFYKHISFEIWLIMGFGEFFFFSMPQHAIELIDKVDEKYKKRFFHMRYNNILLVPPNMPIYSNGGNAYLSTLNPYVEVNTND